ncbi:DUF4911 domain-containing protein [Candidatus Sumerlaeota bacterium]|nr:DUF4911 domain-containing protein [Candidatus Sumerlaeota bacterium]
MTLQCLVNPHDIGYICCIVESYEGLAVVSTIDERKGLLHFYCTIDLRDEFMEFFEQLKKEIHITILSERKMNAEEMNAIEYSSGKNHPRKRNIPADYR